MADSVKKAHCNRCAGLTNHDVLNSVKKVEDDTVVDHGHEFHIGWGDHYFFLQCRGCESVTTLHESWFSEVCDYDGNPIIEKAYYPPAISRPVPKWLRDIHSSEIQSLMQQIYRAFHNDSLSLAAMGVRAVIEAIMIEKVGDQNSFHANLKEFESKGFISKIQRTTLDTALDLGHATIHRAFSPDTKQIGLAMDILENLVHVLYFLEHQSANESKRIPKRISAKKK